MYLSLCPQSALYSIINVYKAANMALVYIGYPFLLFVIKTHARVSSSAVAAYWAVGLILRWGCETQVNPSIVVWLKIDVVDLAWRPFARHYQPNEAVSAIGVFVYTYAQSAIWAEPSCNVAGLVALTEGHRPADNPRFRLIIQDRTHVFGGKVVARGFMSAYRVASHPALLKRWWLGTVLALQRRPSRPI